MKPGEVNSAKSSWVLLVDGTRNARCISGTDVGTTKSMDPVITVAGSPFHLAGFPKNDAQFAGAQYQKCGFRYISFIRSPNNTKSHQNRHHQLGNCHFVNICELSPVPYVNYLGAVTPSVIVKYSNVR